MRSKVRAFVMSIVIILISAFCLAACNNKLATEKNVETIGIIGAMEEEVITLKNAMSSNEIVTVAGKEFHKGILGKAKVVVVQCDMGKVNAGICTSALINAFGCTKIINTGVAGSLDDSLRKGDVVISVDAVQHDFDATPIGYEIGEVPYTGKVAFVADEEMVAKAYESAKEYGKQGQAYKGRICTGDRFIASKEEKERIVSNFGGLCCDMESAAIAQTCYLHKVPFVILREISDSPGETDPMEYEEEKSEYSMGCADIVENMIKTYY